MFEQKGIALGVDDFKKLITEDCYYIDKTKFIEEIIRDKIELSLFKEQRTKNKEQRTKNSITYLNQLIKKILQKAS